MAALAAGYASQNIGRHIRADLFWNRPCLFPKRQHRWIHPLATLLSALSIQIGTNLVNDALDFKKGTDTKERLGPKRVTASGLLSMEQVLAGDWPSLPWPFSLAFL